MNETTEKKDIKAPRRKIMKGTVVSNKMDQTIVVAVNRRKKHPLYSKIIRLTKKYMAHDPKEEAGIGDFVQIEETRPISKMKRWRLVKILEKAR